MYCSIAVEFDSRICLAGSVEDILSDIKSSRVTFGAEAASPAVNFIRMYTDGTIGCVARKGFHDIELVVMGKAGVGGRNG